MSRREKGVIKWYSQRKKFGFIVRDNAEIFFYINDCREFIPQENLTVEFETGLDRMSRTKAINIVSVSVGVENENKINL